MSGREGDREMGKRPDDGDRTEMEQLKQQMWPTERQEREGRDGEDEGSASLPTRCPTRKQRKTRWCKTDPKGISSVHILRGKLSSCRKSLRVDELLHGATGS